MAKQTLPPQQAFWTYRADSATPPFDEIPAGAFCGTEDEWASLSPGMRREIVRSFTRAQKAQDNASS